MSEFVVGIDLGTTHTVVARARRKANERAAIVETSQFVSDGSVGRRPLLPSVLFAPLTEEAALDPWNDAPFVIGEYARIRAQRLPGRAVTSAKSWLCHPGIDRLARTLPWGASESDTPKVSPVDASRRILSHVQRAYDEGSAGHPLAAQEIVLTVPASFDEVARELTVRAATEAGLRVRLLEEPLAAFYGYLAAQGDAALGALLSPSRSEAFVLIADVGGGTTDLTLVRVRPADGGVRLERVAVGRHLLLGGDNMDLALAHAVEQAMPEESRLDPALFAELVLACRGAKERLLAPDPPAEETVRVLGRGSSLVGSVHGGKLTREQVETIVLDGFFPVVDMQAEQRETRAALVGFGLPYERDAAITRHVAAFLRRHLPHGTLPDAVLLNGGVFRAPRVRRRFLDVLAQGDARPVELLADDPDLAVARGAAVFALSLAGFGPRIGGGSARGYYIGLAPEGGLRRAICVVPRGSAEGERHVVRVPGLALVIGQPVRFDLYASDSDSHAAGAVVAVNDDFDALPSMTASFETTGSDPIGGRIPVHLEGELTAIGTVDVACVGSRDAATAPSRFRLAFDLRPKTAPPSVAPASARSSRRPSARPDDAKMTAALALVDRVFGKGRADADPREARHLLRELEKVLGERASWTTDVSRALADAVTVEPKARKRSVDHERTFWMLAGYGLRPGYGYPLDERRVGKLLPLLPELVAYPDEARTWAQFWIAWRRVAGGLLEPAQTKIRDLLDPFLSTDEPKPKRPKNVRPQALPEMLDLVASLERVAPSRRVDLGRWIVEMTWRDRDPRLWTALSRVGARAPAYASAHHAVPTNTVERWLDHLLREKWADVPTAGRAAAQMARVTGDRARDVSEPLRAEIAKRLEAQGAPAEWVRSVREYVAVGDAERAEFFGESLPVGLVIGG
ncbi:MAG TPA: Hsp70 family protein [Polyangiaceae bacterium]|nr:Hsp70 family protein [Polyangiaceae bacterium]